MTKAPLSINRLLKPIKAQRPQLRKMATDSNPSALMRTLSFRNHPNIKIPRVIYGTAWKKDRTATLVYQALKAGFRAIDTAAQPRHYNEAEVGAGIRRAIGEGIIRREDLYVSIVYLILEVARLMALDSNQIHASIRTGSCQHAILPIPESTGSDHILYKFVFAKYDPSRLRAIH
jgi:hypothetical protein